MTTAQRILSSNSTAQAIEAVARELATKTTAANCYSRTWTFYDGSSITKTQDGYTVEVCGDDDGECPTCGEDGGTSCGIPNCGLLA